MELKKVGKRKENVRESTLPSNIKSVKIEDIRICIERFRKMMQGGKTVRKSN
jgi:hypothetical protein